MLTAPRGGGEDVWVTLCVPRIGQGGDDGGEGLGGMKRGAMGMRRAEG